MGKKAQKGGDGAAAATAAGAGAGAAIPWADVDRDPVGFLVAPEKTEAFFSECWERAPRVFKATPARAALAARLTTLPTLLAWLRAQEAEAGGESPLMFGRDVNAARYKDGVRETPNGPGQATAEDLRRLHDDEGCTLQVHQPQRWEDDAWRLLAALEARLGALVGANAYLTPPGTQGLAPHHDDVELWVIQTAGSKRWRCYAPVNGHALPSAVSGDLPEDVIGEPILEATLEPGDVLFLPRGTVHQAVAPPGGGPSAHVTVSTYQRASYGDLALHLLGTALRAQGDEPERCLPLAARRGPPPGLVFDHSLHRVLARPAGAAGGSGDAAGAGGNSGGVAAALAAALREVADKVASEPDMLTAAVHGFGADFWRSRLPPHPDQLAPKGPPPELDNRVWCRASRWCTLLPHDGPAGGGGGSDDEGEGEEDEDEHEGAVKLVTCLHNARETHMCGGADDSDDIDSDDVSVLEGPGSSDEEEEQEGEEDEEEQEEKGKGKGNEGGKAAKAGAKAEAAEEGGAHEHAGGCCGGGEHGHHHHGGGGSGDEEEEDGGSSDGGDSGSEDLGGPEGLPGMVFPGGDTLKALVAVLNADTPDKAVAVRDLPLAHDAEKLHLAFALWAEGFAATVKGRGSGGGGGGGGKKAKQAGGGSGGPPAKKAKAGK